MREAQTRRYESGVMDSSKWRERRSLIRIPMLLLSLFLIVDFCLFRSGSGVHGSRAMRRASRVTRGWRFQVRL
jgi:hypothetical protein